MPHTKSEKAVAQLARLKVDTAPAGVSLGFKEDSSLHTAKWAVRKFGEQVLAQQVIDAYDKDPLIHKITGEKVYFEDLGGTIGQSLEFAQMNAQLTAREVGDDLEGAIKRRARGYSLGSFAVSGPTETAAIIGSMEMAVEVHPENLAGPDQYMRANAEYVLAHMNVSGGDGSHTEYLL